MANNKLPFEISIHDIGVNPYGEITISLRVRYHKTGFSKVLDSTEIYVNISKEIKRTEN